MEEFKMEKVIEMIETQLAKGTDFESLVYEFKQRVYDCTVSVNNIKGNGWFVVDIGVEVPDTNRMFYMGCARERSLEGVLDCFKNEENEKIVQGYISILIRRVNEE